MKISSFAENERVAEESKAVLKEHGRSLSYEQAHAAIVNVKRHETLKKISAVTGHKLGVLEGGAANIAGVTDTASLKVGIRDDILVHNFDEALDVARHEIEHVETDMFFDMDEMLYLKGENLEAMRRFLQQQGIQMSETRWYEGATENSKAHKHGKNDNCAYNGCDVPAVEKLDQLCIDLTGASPMEAFKSRNKSAFKERIKAFSNVILARELAVKLSVKMAA